MVSSAGVGTNHTAEDGLSQSNTQAAVTEVPLVGKNASILPRFGNTLHLMQ